jgi:hypothetical protein
MLNPLNSTMLATALTILCHSFLRDISEGALLITPLYLGCFTDTGYKKQWKKKEREKSFIAD